MPEQDHDGLGDRDRRRNPRGARQRRDGEHEPDAARARAEQHVDQQDQAGRARDEYLGHCGRDVGVCQDHR